MALFLLAACGPVVVSLAPAPVAEGAPRTPVADGDLPDALVDCAGGGDFTTIGDAVAAAVDGDLVHVAPCTYTESIDFAGKALRIVSTGSSADTFVDGRGGGAAVRAVLGEGTGTTLEGFTISNGGSAVEPAVYVDFASLRLVDVVLSDNRGWATIYGTSADVELAGVTVAGNRTSSGVAVYMSRGGLVASDLVVDCDAGSTGILLGHGSGVLDRAEIACGGGVATDWSHAVGRIQRSVFEGAVTILAEDDHYDDYVNIANTVVDGSVSATYGSLTVRNSVVSGGITLSQVYLATVIEGSVVTDAPCGIQADTADFTVRNNLFWGNGADACGLLPNPVDLNENRAADPSFTDAPGGDWSLRVGSPAVDAGPDEPEYTDVDGTRNDIGVHGGPLSIGGGW